jgi:octaprenyl-diphosphate synthase
MAQADAATRARLRAIVEQGDIGGLGEVQAAIAAAGSLAYSREQAARHAAAAERRLDALRDNAWVAALRGIARYAVARDH